MPAPMTAPMPSITRSKAREGALQVAARFAGLEAGLMSATLLVRKSLCMDLLPRSVGSMAGRSGRADDSTRVRATSAGSPGCALESGFPATKVPRRSMHVLVVMRQDATAEQIRGVAEAIEARGFKAHPIPGAQRTAIGITGNKGALEAPGLREPARRARGHPGLPRLQARLARGEARGHDRPHRRRARRRARPCGGGRALRGRVAASRP